MNNMDVKQGSRRLTQKHQLITSRFKINKHLQPLNTFVWVHVNHAKIINVWNPEVCT